MTDITAPDGSPAAAPEHLIPTDANGDPMRQGSLMNERQSYERAIEGLKIAADAAAHLRAIETENQRQWAFLAKNLDQARRICVQYAGLGLVIKERQTAKVEHRHMGWRKARERFREGLLQAAGGMRQLATCHRGDLWWSRMAASLDRLEMGVRKPRLSAPEPSLWMPKGMRPN